MYFSANPHLLNLYAIPNEYVRSKHGLIISAYLKIQDIYFKYCYGEICNHHRNSLNKGPCHWSPYRKTRRDTLDRTREELHTLSL